MLSLLPVLMLASNPCGPLDLPTVLALVASRSDEVAIKQADVLGAQADVALARALGVIPLATATVLTGPAPGARGNIVSAPGFDNRNPFTRLGPFGRIDINVIQPIFTFGQITDAREAAAAGVHARGLLVMDTLRQVQERVVQLYWGIVLARRFLSIAADVEDALKQVDQKIQESLDKGTGDVIQADKFRVQVFRGDLLQKKADAQKALKLARLALSGTLALDEAALVLKEDVLPSALELTKASPAQVMGVALQKRPDLRALSDAITAREALVRQKEAARLPTVFLVGTFTYAGSTNRDIQHNPWVHDDFNQLSGGVGLGLRENLAFPTMNAELEKARAELQGLRRQREGLSRLVRVEAESGVAELTAAEDRFTAAHGSVMAGRGWFRSSGISFNLGVTDAKALLEAYTGFVQTQVNESQSRFDVLLAKAHLDTLMGNVFPQGETQCTLP